MAHGLVRPRWVRGKTIARIELRPFADGRGGTAHDPVIVFTDGSALGFMVEETDVGAYGVAPIYAPKGNR